MRILATKRNVARCETLESRQHFSVSLGTNLLVNGDAEADVGAADSTTVVNPTGWRVGSTTSITPGFTAVKYGTSGFPTASSPGPTDRGNNFFAGGPTDADDSLFQMIDVSSLAADIDANRITANLSGWLGGFSTQSDNMTLSLQYFKTDTQTTPDSSASISGPLPTERGNLTELIQKSLSRLVPAQTRFIGVELESVRSSTGYNDGYADDISLTLSSGASKGLISGAVNDDGNGSNTMGGGLRGVSVFIDSNKNGKFDKGELAAKTHSNGRYTFSNISRGTYNVVELVPKTFRAITASTISVTVKNGLTTTQDFTVSQTALIGGQVFADKNADKKIDKGDLAGDGILIYLDTNNNGQFDTFELNTITTPKGNWRLTVPFGTYIIRQSFFGTTKQILPAKTSVMAIGKGEVSLKNNFLDTFVVMGL